MYNRVQKKITFVNLGGDNEQVLDKVYDVTIAPHVNTFNQQMQFGSLAQKKINDQNNKPMITSPLTNTRQEYKFLLNNKK